MDKNPVLMAGTSGNVKLLKFMLERYDWENDAVLYDLLRIATRHGYYVMTKYLLSLLVRNTNALSIFLPDFLRDIFNLAIEFSREQIALLVLKTLQSIRTTNQATFELQSNLLEQHLWCRSKKVGRALISNLIKDAPKPKYFHFFQGDLHGFNYKMLSYHAGMDLLIHTS